MSITRHGKHLGIAGTLEDSFQVGGITGPKIVKVGTTLQLQDVDGTPVATEPLLPINVQPTDYTLVTTDAGKIVEMARAIAQSLTVPSFASVAFAPGTQIEVLQTGAGVLTIVAGAGVTISSASTLIALKQFARLYLHRTEVLNTWTLTGDLKRTAVPLTQTFATADATLAARTAVALTDSTGGVVSTTLAAPSTPVASAGADTISIAALNTALATFRTDIIAHIASLADQVNKARVDDVDTASFVNSLVDALQLQLDSGVS